MRNEPVIETPETAYGKKVHKLIENDDPIAKRIPKYLLKEYKLELNIGGVPIMGVLG